MTKVAHLTSAHPRMDTRIFLKELKSLATANYDVSLIVADGKGDATNRGIKVFDVGLQKNRLKRFIASSYLVYKKALSLDASIYHFHDPELLPYGFLLKLHGKKVIYDSHEDVPKQIKGKYYINKNLRTLVSNLFYALERIITPSFDYIITATPSINEKFSSYHSKVATINNFPIEKELFQPRKELSEEVNYICYIGSITRIRGIFEVIESLNLLPENYKLLLAGNFESDLLKKDLESKPEWSKVEYLGQLNREEVSEVLMKSKVGLVTFLPLPNHIDAQPNKFFEYMSTGLPIVASNFPLWREIIEGVGCGKCIDPNNPQEIASAIKEICEKPSLDYKKLSTNAIEAIESKYNWTREENKLLILYSDIINKGRQSL